MPTDRVLCSVVVVIVVINVLFHKNSRASPDDPIAVVWLRPCAMIANTTEDYLL